MEHEHSHNHNHSHQITSLSKAFVLGIILNSIFVFAEFVAGFYYDSLALLSDAGHNLSDVVSLILALIAFKLAKVKPNAKYTYGYKKSTILVSLLNAVILLVVVGGIIVESIQKIRYPQEVQGGAIAWVAGIGVFINAITALLFIKHKGKDLNVKGAYLHMMADALVSVGVLIAGVVIGMTGLYVIDPIISIVVAIVILVSVWNLLHDSVRLSLDGVPVGIDSENIKETVSKIPGVANVHHLHIWAMSTTENALTAHVVVENAEHMEEVKNSIKHELEHCGINHATLEFEIGMNRCHEDCN